MQNRFKIQLYNELFILTFQDVFKLDVEFILYIEIKNSTELVMK